MRKHRRKHYDTMETPAKKKFRQDNQQRYSKMIQKRRKKDFPSKKKNTSH